MFLSSATTDKCACDNIMQLIFIISKKSRSPPPLPRPPRMCSMAWGVERKSYLDHNPSHLYAFFQLQKNASLIRAEGCCGKQISCFLQQQTATSWAMHFSLYPFEKSTLSLDVLARNGRIAPSSKHTVVSRPATSLQTAWRLKESPLLTSHAPPLSEGGSGKCLDASKACCGRRLNSFSYLNQLRSTYDDQ